jgi:bifunctional UDP-N-acetylglucosamine pyrophosphorylase/glucosamine-1-phosphate N-acetyltransferase
MINAVILAWDSTCQMHSKLPKVLHECAGLPMVAYSVRLAHAVGAERIIIVVDSSSREIVETTLQPLFEEWPLEFIHADAENQEVQGVIWQGLNAVHNECEEVIILHGDMPLVQSRSVNLVRQHAEKTGFAILQGREPIDSSGSADVLRRSAGARETGTSSGEAQNSSANGLPGTLPYRTYFQVPSPRN